MPGSPLSANLTPDQQRIVRLRAQRLAELGLHVLEDVDLGAETLPSADDLALLRVRYDDWVAWTEIFVRKWFKGTWARDYVDLPGPAAGQTALMTAGMAHRLRAAMRARLVWIEGLMASLPDA